MKKRMLALATAMLLIASCFAAIPVSAEEGDLSLSIESVSPVNSGSTTTVSVYATSGKTLEGFDLAFKPEAGITVGSLTVSPSAVVKKEISTNKDSDGVLHFLYIGVNEDDNPLIGEGPIDVSNKTLLFTFDVTVSAAAGTTFTPFTVVKDDFAYYDTVNEKYVLHNTTASVSAIRTKSNIATLATLTVNGADVLSSLAITVPNSTTEVTVAATKTDAKATVSGTGVKTLDAGTDLETSLVVTVTAEDGTTQNYTIVVTREAAPTGLTSTLYRIDAGTGYIRGVAPGTDVATFTGNLTGYNSETVTVVGGGANVGTGTTLTVGGKLYTVIIIGDIDGNGAIDSIDSDNLRKAASWGNNPTTGLPYYSISSGSVYFIASDLDDSGAIDSIDSDNLRKAASWGNNPTTGLPYYAIVQ